MFLIYETGSGKYVNLSSTSKFTSDKNKASKFDNISFNRLFIDVYFQYLMDKGTLFKVPC